MKRFVSRNHFLSIDDVNKIALSAFNNKRFYDNDGNKSLAFGHFRTGPKSNYTKTCQEASRNQSDFKTERENSCPTDTDHDSFFIKEGKVFDLLDTNSNEDCSDSAYYFTSDNEADFFFKPPDPGLNRTAEESSDEDNIIDWNAPVFGKPYLKCSYIDDGAAKADLMPRKRSKFS